MSFVSQSVVLAEFKLGNKKEVLHGIVFRDNNKLGLIIPKIKGLENEQSIELTINAPGQYKQELEFTLDLNKIYIHSNEFLSFIPLKELQMNGFKIDYSSSSYSREVLNCIKYSMSYDIYQGQLNNSPVITSFLGGIADKLVLTQWYNILYYSETPKEIPRYTFINVLDIDLYNGSPMVYSGSYISGIVISNPDIKCIDRYKNTGIIVSADYIIDLISGI